MKAKLKYHHKALIDERFVVEITLHGVSKSKKYPEGLKYGLICFDKKTERKVLFDNHHPKGHHLHINGLEMDYDYFNEEKLFSDFEKIVFENLGVKL